MVNAYILSGIILSAFFTLVIIQFYLTKLFTVKKYITPYILQKGLVLMSVKSTFFGSSEFPSDSSGITFFSLS
jgi:hypothetical protein